MLQIAKIANYDYLKLRVKINYMWQKQTGQNAKRKATNQYIIKQYTNPKMIGHKNRFEFLVILVAIALLAVATINNISSTKSGGSHDTITIIINYARAQTEAKVSIVPGASTLGEKGFSPNPVNIKVGDTVF